NRLKDKVTVVPGGPAQPVEVTLERSVRRLDEGRLPESTRIAARKPSSCLSFFIHPPPGHIEEAVT
ncbi:MAG TPA: hypothetical protein VKD72_13610, partial [Gemmataceae bacterium]|nr:hypothetical protein [Gemmataceae bacterium]